MFCLSTTACESTPVVAQGFNASLDGDDLVRITNDIAAQISADPDVQAAIAAEGTLPIVVLPVENRMTGEVLPQGQKVAFTARVRNLLARQNAAAFTWIVNRDEFYAVRAAELARGGGANIGPSPDVLQPRYALHARFQTLTNDDRNHRSIYYLCVYTLTDITDRTTLWTGSYELKKSAVKGFLD